jgi:hypothetical protein
MPNCLGTTAYRGKGFAKTETYQGLPKSKAPIPGAIGMRAKLAFVTLISKGGVTATGQQGENRVASVFR